VAAKPPLVVEASKVIEGRGENGRRQSKGDGRSKGAFKARALKQR
jgi:hypothetical protein